MATPPRDSNWLAIGAVRPTASIRRTNPRRDRFPLRTRPIRFRSSRSSIEAPFGVWPGPRHSGRRRSYDRGYQNTSARPGQYPPSRSGSAAMHDAVIAARVIDQPLVHGAHLHRVRLADEHVVGADLDDLHDTAVK